MRLKPSKPSNEKMEGGFIKSIVFDGRQKFEKILNRIKIKKFIVDYLKY